MNSLLHQSLQVELRVDVPERESEILDAIRYIYWHYVKRILDVRDARLHKPIEQFVVRSPRLSLRPFRLNSSEKP